MNPQRRKDLKLIVNRFQEVKSLLQGVIEEEEASLTNLPESLQNSQRASDMQQVVDDLQAAFDNLEESVGELSDIAGIKPLKDKHKSVSHEDRLREETNKRRNKFLRAASMLREVGYFVELENERKNLVHLRKREDVMSEDAWNAVLKAERAHERKNQILKKEVKDTFETQNAPYQGNLGKNTTECDIKVCRVASITIKLVGIGGLE